MRRTETAEQVLVTLIGSIQYSLAELTSDSDRQDDFVCGQMYAYIECLELIQLWQNAKKFGIDGNLEKKYSLP